MSLSARNLLLTGLPGCGKTTAVRRLVERLADLRLAGFYTQELCEAGSRVGFEAVGLSTACSRGGGQERRPPRKFFRESRWLSR
jgi:nucleoside-triphosphatase THEP1